MTHTHILKEKRKRLGLSQEDVARRIGMSADWYNDLEHREDELYLNVSLESVKALFASLQLRARELFPSVQRVAPSTARITFDALRTRLVHHLNDEATSLPHFEEKIGWTLNSFILDPNSAYQWNLDCLRSVCTALQIDWLSVVETLEQR